jgi:hypothetical protein
MLTEAYHQLGVNSVRELDARAREAWEYLCKDREHYNEVVDADTPEYCITANDGVICKLIPLAREIIQDQEKDHLREHTAIFSLMVSDSGNRFVYSYCYAKLYQEPSQNSYSYPVYRYAELKDIRKGLRIFPPQEIRPAATELEWESYCMMFAAFAQLDRSQTINTIPHKTERAMQAYAYALPQELTITGRSYLGKLVPLAWEESMWEQMREDHRYSYRKELCLLVTPEKPYYVLKTCHIYRYFRADISGDRACKPAHEKQETTYAFVKLSDLSQDMHPLYY